MADTEVNRAVALGVLACMNEQDYERLWSEYLTEDSTWTLIAKGAEPMRGRCPRSRRAPPRRSRR